MSPLSRSLADHSHVVRRLLFIAWQHRGRCSAVLALQLSLHTLTLLGLRASGLALDVLRHALVEDAPAPQFPWGVALTGWSPYSVLIALAGSIVVMGVARAAISYGYTLAVAELVQGHVVPKLRSQVYDKLQQLSFRFFDRHKSGTLLNRVTGDVQSLRSFIDAVLIQGLVIGLALVVYGAYMLSRHVGLTVLCLATTPALWILTVRFSRRIMPAYGRSRERLDELVLGVSESVHGIAVIKSFAGEPRALESLAQKNRDVLDSQHDIFRQVSRYTPTIDLLNQANLLLLVLGGGMLVVYGKLTLGDLVVFAGLLQLFSAQVTSLATLVNTLQESLIGARRVFEVLDTPAEIVTRQPSRQTAAVRGHVRFERVSFAYEPERPALSELTFEARPGECIALYGAAGAGKTTLLSLIPRFYDPTSGAVFVDGVDVRELDVNQLRRSVAVVFQDTFLFSHTVAANLALGHPEADQAQIERAARLASAHEFIERLPHGYQTVLGELATDLSGGQRQRLAIARALLSDPRILLLDDPTAALDAETTREILTSLRTAAHGRTTIMVSHRPALLSMADRILVLERGRLVQQGSHAELSAVPGPYRELLRLHAYEAPPPRAAARGVWVDEPHV